MSRNTQELNDKKYTYAYFSRKNACRLCWKITKGAVSIESDALLAQFITKQMGIKVKGHYLQTICPSCAANIKNFIKFKKFCLQADLKLNRILKIKNEKFEDNYHDPNILRKEAKLELKFLEIAVTKEDFKLNFKDDICHESQKFKNALTARRLLKRLDNYRPCLKMSKKSMPQSIPNIVKVENSELNKKESLKLASATKHYEEDNKQMSQSGLKTENNSLKCLLCAEVFNNHTEYRNHRIEKHPKNKKVVCEICGRMLSQRYAVSHMSLHNNHKVKCPHCDRSFTLNENLKAHIRRVHMGERRFACHICPLRCFSSSILKKHLKTHFGIKDFKCQLCPKTYSTKVALQKHVKLFHEGLVGQNKCNYCPSQYNDLKSLRKHMLKKHGKRIKACRGSIIEIDVSNNEAGENGEDS